MNKTFGLLFYLKMSKVDTKGRAPIYLRITIEGRRAEISVKRSLLPFKWNTQAQRANGRTEPIKKLKLKHFQK